MTDDTKQFTILIATYNRLPLLKRVIHAVESGTKTPHRVIVIDGGSTDGTTLYLKSKKGITAVFQGKLLGTARTYNTVWKRFKSKYTCWLSDDTEVKKGSLDLAVNILKNDSTIGMVGLKMKDTLGPWKNRPYMGSVSEMGVLTCNHAVLPYRLLKDVGFFNEAYYSYTIDPDLTASILCIGRKVVMTKEISVLHHRKWSEHISREKAVMKKKKISKIDNKIIYRRKFNLLKRKNDVLYSMILSALQKTAESIFSKGNNRIGTVLLDVYNISSSPYIRWNDYLISFLKPYHLIQKIPEKLLRSKYNPYLQQYTSNLKNDEKN